MILKAGLCWSFCVAALLFVRMPSRAQTDSKSRIAGVRKIEAFDYKGVRLDDGALKRQFDETRDYYLRIPNDDLLKGFRKRAGLPAPGVDLGGWYSDDTFHVFGQIISGLARMYAATGDQACKDKAEYLIAEWGKCIAGDGYFFFSTKPNAPHYIYEKICGGLVDMLAYCGDKKAGEYLSKITDWATKNLDRTRPYGADPNEWYTLSENLYRAWLVTGDSKYRDFAKVWEYTDYWNAYAEKRSIFDKRADGKQTGAYHAYSHVNTLSGAGAAYLVSGEQHYLDTLINAYDTLRSDQCFATGGFGPNEQLLPRNSLLNALNETHASFETQCGSWAIFKLCKYLITLTGDARFGDWIEQMTTNGIGASIPMSADGKVFYYSDYNPSGAWKQNVSFGWSCCTGTRPMAAADFHDLIYFHDSSHLYVNLYTPSTLTWKQPGGDVTIQQITRFPESDKVEFVIASSRQQEFSLSLRQPGWLSSPMEVILPGGRAQRPNADSHGWISIRRKWRTGDRLQVRLPAALRVARNSVEKPYPAAILYGPVVLAARQSVKGQKNPADSIALDHPETSLIPSPGESLTYHLKSDPAILVRPFYAFKEGERYLMYLDPEASNRYSHRDVTFSQGWNDAGIHRFINRVGATAEFTFEGTGIRWIGWRYDDAGKAEVQIDGKVVATVDQYGPGRELPFEWKVNGLAAGKHTLRITLLSDKNPASRDRFLNVGGFQVQP